MVLSFFINWLLIINLHYFSIFSSCFLLNSSMFWWKLRKLLDIFEMDLPQSSLANTEASIQGCSYEKVFWKYAAKSQSNVIEIALRHCKFTAYFQNTFFSEHHWMVAFVIMSTDMNQCILPNTHSLVATTTQCCALQ